MAISPMGWNIFKSFSFHPFHSISESTFREVSRLSRMEAKIASSDAPASPQIFLGWHQRKFSPKNVCRQELESFLSSLSLGGSSPVQIETRGGNVMLCLFCSKLSSWNSVFQNWLPYAEDLKKPSAQMCCSNLAIGLHQRTGTETEINCNTAR